jgi:hypothetical protein
MNVAKITATEFVNEVYLRVDKPRQTLPYSYYQDINGKYGVQNYDYQTNSSTGSDYVNVNFSLASPPIPEKVYVGGAFSDYSLSDDYLMTYNQERKVYEGSALLKQGWYNYSYGINRPGTKELDLTAIEGSYIDTENQYEIIVYIRPVGARSDVIIGYVSRFYNSRK